MRTSSRDNFLSTFGRHIGMRLSSSLSFASIPNVDRLDEREKVKDPAEIGARAGLLLLFCFLIRFLFILRLAFLPNLVLAVFIVSFVNGR